MLGLTDETVKMSYDAFEDTYLKVISAQAAKRSSPDEKLQYAKNVFSDMFRNLDVSGDGVISFKEWSAHYQCIGVDTAHARASFDAMDKNGDGKVTEEEFVSYNYEYYYTAENICMAPSDSIEKIDHRIITFSCSCRDSERTLEATKLLHS